MVAVRLRTVVVVGAALERIEHARSAELVLRRLAAALVAREQLAQVARRLGDLARPDIQ